MLNDHIGDFDTLLQNKNDTCNHRRNIKTLMVEICKIKNNQNPSIMDFMTERRSLEIFKILRQEDNEL